MSSEQTALADTDPRMISWKAYQQTEEYANAMRWLAVEQHREGSMWASFIEGWRALGTQRTPCCEGLREILRGQLRSDGHNRGCSFSTSIGDADPNADYCNCNKTIAKALAHPCSCQRTEGKEVELAHSDGMTTTELTATSGGESMGSDKITPQPSLLSAPVESESGEPDSSSLPVAESEEQFILEASVNETKDYVLDQSARESKPEKFIELVIESLQCYVAKSPPASANLEQISREKWRAFKYGENEDEWCVEVITDRPDRTLLIAGEASCKRVAERHNSVLQSALAPVQSDAALALERIRDLEEQREALQAEINKSLGQTLMAMKENKRLQSELEQAKQENAKMTTEMRAMRGHWNDISAALGVKGDEDYYNAPINHAANLQAHLATAEADSRRLETVEREKWQISFINSAQVYRVQQWGQVCGNLAEARTLRESIDAAAQAKP